MTTQTQTTAQVLAGDLQKAEQAVADLQSQRAGVIAKIVAGKLEPEALDEHDSQIATAMADAERRREIATAADAEAKRQQREAARQSDFDAITSMIESHRVADQKCKSLHGVYVRAIEAARIALDDLRAAQADRAGFARGAESKCEAFEKQWPDDEQPKCPRLSQAGVSGRAKLVLQVPHPSVYASADSLDDPLSVTA